MSASSASSGGPTRARSTGGRRSCPDRPPTSTSAVDRRRHRERRGHRFRDECRVDLGLQRRRRRDGRRRRRRVWRDRPRCPGRRPGRPRHGRGRRRPGRRPRDRAHGRWLPLDDGTAIGADRPGRRRHGAPRPDRARRRDQRHRPGRRRLDDGPLGVLVTDPPASASAATRRPTMPDGRGVAATPALAAASAAAPARSRGRPAGRRTRRRRGGLPGAGAGLASLLGIGVLSVAVTVLRRRQTRALLAAPGRRRGSPRSPAADRHRGRPSRPIGGAPGAVAGTAGPDGAERGVSVGHAR